MGSCERLTTTEYGVVVGTLLGDGFLEQLTSGTVRLSVAHGLGQRHYAYWMYRKLRRLVATPPVIQWFRDRRYAYPVAAVRFRTRRHPELKQRLQQALWKKYGIPTTLHRLRRWKRIYISARHSERFARIIAPFVPASMRYKLQYALVNPVTTDPARVR